MRGNSQARFLGGLGLATVPGYPTSIPIKVNVSMSREMGENVLDRHISAPLGSVEPHAPMLSVPHEGQSLYKMMTVENLLHSIIGNYLNFNRVDADEGG